MLPYYLQLYLACERHNTLLVAGGILEQPELLWYCVSQAGAIWDTISAQRQRLQQEAATYESQQ